MLFSEDDCRLIFLLELFVNANSSLNPILMNLFLSLHSLYFALLLFETLF